MLGNLIQGSAALRDRFREAGGVDALMEVMAKGNTANSDVQGQMAFVIDSFLSERSVPRVPRQVVRKAESSGTLLRTELFSSSRRNHSLHG